MSSADQTTPLPDLRFDAVDLIGRPGAHRRVSRSVTAPGLDATPAAMWVAPGADIALVGSLESVVEGIYAGGTVTAHVTGECSRCLDPLQDDVEVRIGELFAYPEKIPHDMSAEDREEVVILEGDTVDLGPLVYDALVLASPAVPLCRPDCEGLCPQCGIRLEDDPDHHHEVIDSRFAALQGLLEKAEDAEQEPGTAHETAPDRR